MAYFETQKLKDKTGQVISPAENEQIVLLRRLVKLIETQSAADAAQRQRVIVDAGTITTVSSVSSAVLAAGTALIGSIINQQQIGGFSANDQVPALMHLQADNLRRNITVT